MKNKELKNKKSKNINKLNRKNLSKPKKPYTLKSPFEVGCMSCENSITVLFCPPRQGYSNKNNWGWWTKKPEDEGRYRCNQCIVDLYKNHKIKYLEAITDSEKRSRLRSYLYNSIVE